MTEAEISEYRSLLGTLKRNKEKVSLERLKTEYQKGYDQLTQKIRSMTREILQDEVLKGLQIERAQADQKYMEINAVIKESGILKMVSHAAFTQQDADQVFEYASQLREIVHRIVKGDQYERRL
ncbi:hypothetical protein [Lacrimispora sp.]|jgi:predicted methyltransferase|uniref:hypothetical protein n=1 Tax=Lacrimispora sp. TaxID=2719234 RepID=UPI0028AC8CDC|nr:hypothetical protein [Lacrimispora sp.]